MPDSRACRGLAKCTRRPSTSTSPLVGFSTPVRILITVDLPAPFSPSRQWISLGCSDSERFFTAVTPKNRFVTPRNSTTGETRMPLPSPERELAQPMIGEHREQQQQPDEELGQI